MVVYATLEEMLSSGKTTDFQKWIVNADGTLVSVQCPGMVLDVGGSSWDKKGIKANYNVADTASQVCGICRLTTFLGLFYAKMERLLI